VGSGLDGASSLVLEALQYGMAPGPEPFDGAASPLGMDAESLLREARRLRRAGIIRRIGISLHPRSLGGASALVLAAVPGDRAMEYARVVSSSSGGRSKHSYVRSFPRYNLWFTYRARGPESLLEEIGGLLSPLGVDDYVVLTTARVCKLSVKYDLERGTSWSQPGVLPEDPPLLGELGVDRALARRLQDLPVSRRPFRELAAEVGETEEGLLDLVGEMFSRGAAVDFGAVLDPEAIGFRHGAVVMGSGGAAECERVATLAPEATHAILREPAGGARWDLRVYFVIQARRREDVEAAAGRAAELAGIEERELAYGEGGITL
jgi:DNA-binding Lrp family transcriptional regulator